MATAKAGDTVRVHYTGKLSDGSVFDSSEGQEPFEFELGAGEVIPGFDETIIGMAAGNKETVTLPVDKAYGERNDELLVTVARAEMPDDLGLEVGMALELEQGEETIVVHVAEIDETEVVLDANHPLAGQELTFELELVEICG